MTAQETVKRGGIRSLAPLETAFWIVLAIYVAFHHGLHVDAGGVAACNGQYAPWVI